MLYDSEKRDITMVLTGDLMLTRRLAVFKEPRFLQLRELLRSADVAFTNFETVAHEYEEGTPTLSRGTLMVTEPGLLDDMKWFGINLVSNGNNHAFDYGELGVLANLKHLSEHGIPNAGTGPNLRKARSPVYVDTPGGRVALIAATAFFVEWAEAGEQRPDCQGRPGVNPLNFETSYVVDRQAMSELRRLGAGLGFEADRERLRAFGFFSASEVGVESGDTYNFLGKKFKAGEKFAVVTRANPKDVADNLRQIREARRQADWVIMSLHYHEMGGESLFTAKKRTDLDECASFVRDFAHQCVDEGADLIAGHGPHIALAAEMYKGKPIFHSLGNFLIQNETVRFFGAHAYSRFNLSTDATPADFLDARSDKDTKAHPADPLFWESMCAVCKFKAGKTAEVLLYPVDLGYGRPRPQRGRPLLADATTGEKIIARLARLSQRLGTEIAYRDGVGVINVGK